jgi:type III secretion protein S
MDSDTAIHLTSQAMLLCLTISAPVVLVAAAVGLLVSFVQAITSMQEQTISQAAKMTAVTVVLLLGASWGGTLILRFAQSIMAMISTPT